MLHTKSERYGIHADKNETVVFGRRILYKVVNVCVRIDGTVLENVESFVYLASEFEWCFKDICHKTQVATANCLGSTAIKIQLLEMFVFEVCSRNMNHQERWSVRAVGVRDVVLLVYTRVKWQDHITNDAVRRRVQCEWAVMEKGPNVWVAV